jgi:predicted metal-dependent hydrolase
VVFLNWRLLQLPVRLADYVICHELVHLRVPNHSSAFWTMLDGVQPDWRKRKDELAAQAQTIHWFGAEESYSRAILHTRSA